MSAVVHPAYDYAGRIRERLRRRLQELREACGMNLNALLLKCVVSRGMIATIVASLLPIMWSHRQGAEVMQPPATLVISGMLSSLVHILIVTPVIFLGLRKREL